VNHLLFADDSLIFISANNQSAVRLNEILRIYGDCSGQRVNKEKSAIFFTPNTPAADRQAMKQTLGINVEAFSEKYLGLPTAVGRITSGSFDHIGESSRSKMQGWSEKNLACAARETLLKLVIQSILTYSMTVFLLTKKFCKSYASAMARYWWSSSLDRKSMHWISWSNLSTPKIKGGMGFRDLHLFNIALLGKHGWRFLLNPTSLCARVLKGRYFHDCDFLQANIPRSASATWRAIVAGRQALQAGLIKRVGSGSSISIWTDQWIPESHSMVPMFKPVETELEKVSELIDSDTWTWRRDLVRSVFAVPDADAILNIPLRNGGGEDFYAWNFESSGVYSVKSAYRALVTQKERAALGEGAATETSTTEQQMWTDLWKLKVVPKVRVF
jgi:hypothetical protein